MLQEVARQMQEKEKRKHEMYLEKKKIKDLKKERELLERQLEYNMKEARMVANTDGNFLLITMLMLEKILFVVGDHFCRHIAF